MSKLNFVLAAFLVAGVANAQVSGTVEAPVNDPVTAGAGAGDAGVGVGDAGAGSVGPGAGAGAGGIGAGLGSLTIPVVVASGVVAGVGAAILTNQGGDTVDETPVKVLKCDGTDPLVSGLCVGTRKETKVTVTGTGTGTATRTTTVSVPVTFTYAPK